MNLSLVLFFLLFRFRSALSELFCVQCDRDSQWYSPEENQRIIDACQSGRIQPSRCANESHTHCIFSYYKTSSSKTRTVMERRCGFAEEVVGCTLYKSGAAVPQRLRRHLFSDADAPPRRRETKRNFFVEVCTGGCEGPGCLSSSSDASLFFPSLFLLVRLLL
ncbi:hypothetical protein L596_009308 [Steinernema carpocapsae]|uniref:Secreted protein n=1 Tax=Steinernema carpocapsae TaxID=34508 RepID=A0A4U5PFH8_STECR|nr:hypothetical protein L596_009308 [Steinernema carpocapsae]